MQGSNQLQNGQLQNTSVFERLYEALDGIIDVRNLQVFVLRLLIDNVKITLSWLESKEFKEKYANHPNPPLINPKNVDYEIIPAQYAWELNLPLPPFFDFILLKGHGSGGTGLTSFLRKCGCIQFYGENFLDPQATYISLYNQILNAKNDTNCKYLFVEDFILKGDFAKYFSLIPRKKALFLVRDPISILKHFLNTNRHTMWRAGELPPFNLTFDPNEVLNNCFKYGFVIERDIPSLEEIPFWINYFPICFHDSQILEACKEIQEVLYIDMQEIVGERAFETMVRLAHYFGFTPPTQKADFTHNVAEFNFIINLTLYAHQSDLEKIQSGFSNDSSSINLEGGNPLTITNIYNLDEDKTDITNVFFQESIAPIAIAASKESCATLLENREFTQIIAKYLRNFVSLAFEKNEQEKGKRLTERDVLEYFKHKEFFKKKFQTILEAHTKHVKEHRSDIVESWKYYAEFLRMCD